MAAPGVFDKFTEELPKLIAAGVLTPALGLIGTKIKELLEARDVRQQSRRTMDEVTALLAFNETLRKAATAEGALMQVPSELLERLQGGIADRVRFAVTQISPPSADRIRARHLTRDVLDRIFLLHRPLAWWGWALHVLYYGLLGMLVLVVTFVMGDFATQEPDRWDGVSVLLAFIGACALVNVIANVADRLKARRPAG